MQQNKNQNSTNKGYLFTALNAAGNTLDDQVKARTIPRLVIVKENTPLGRPSILRSVVIDDQGSLECKDGKENEKLRFYTEQKEDEIDWVHGSGPLKSLCRVQAKFITAFKCQDGSNIAMEGRECVCVCV